MAKYFMLIEKDLPFKNYSNNNIAVLYNIYIAEVNAINNFIFSKIIYNYILFILTEDTAACS